MLCTLFHLLQCQNEIIGAWGTSISSWVELQLCLLEASCSPRAKASPSPSLGTLQPSTLNKEGFIAFNQLEKAKGSHCFVPAPRANPQMVSQTAPGPLSPHLKGLRAGAAPAATWICQNPPPFSVHSLGIVVSDSSLWDFII